VSTQYTEKLYCIVTKIWIFKKFEEITAHSRVNILKLSAHLL